MSNQNSYSPGLYPLGYIGVNPTTPPRVFIQSFSPGPVNYQNNSIGDFWLVSGTEQVWILVGLSNTDPSGRALWVELSGSVGPAFIYNADEGSSAEPLNGVMNFFGGLNIITSTIIGAPNTVTIEMDQSITVPGTITMSSLAKGNLYVDSAGIIHSSVGTNNQFLMSYNSDTLWGDITAGDGTISITGTPTGISITAPGGGGGGAGTFVTDINSPATANAGTISILGDGSLTKTTAAGTGTHQVIVGIKDSATAGQLMISGGGAGAAWANLTSSDASITITPGTNSINLQAVGATGTHTFHTDSGDAVESGNAITVAGDGILTKTSGASATVTIGIKNGTQGQVLMSQSSGSATWGHLVAGTNTSLVATTDGSIVINSAGGASGTVSGLGGDSGATASPDGGNVVYSRGDGTSIVTLSNAPNTHSVQISVKSSPTIAGIPTFSGLGTGLIKSTAGLLSNVTAGTIGQMLSTNSTNVPQWTTPIAGTGISITPNPTTGALTIANTSPGVGGITYNCNSGVATPAAGVLKTFGEGSQFAAGTNTWTEASPSGGNTIIFHLQKSLYFPNTNAGGTTGVLFWNGNTAVHFYGTRNSFVGNNAGNLTLSTGSSINNTAMGNNALNNLTTGNNHVAVGNAALTAATTATNCVAIGAFALNLLTTGGNNNTVGSSSGLAITTGSRNDFHGTSSGAGTTTGTDNVYMGYNSGLNNVTGGGNVMIGSQAGASNTSSANTFVGFQAGFANTSGTGNVYMGTTAAPLSTTSSSNVVIGDSAALGMSTTSSNNVIIGFEAASTMSSGSANNIVIGYMAGSAWT